MYIYKITNNFKMLVINMVMAIDGEHEQEKTCQKCMQHIK